MSLNDKALEYHAQGRPGKIKVVPTKSCATAADLSLAYSPGVAAPCLEIEKNPDDAYKYTAKGNLVAVISNGTAVLGLGNLGALAGKPVMEGKGVLFKRFADIDVFDIEVDTIDVATRQHQIRPQVAHQREALDFFVRRVVAGEKGDASAAAPAAIHHHDATSGAARTPA